MMARQPDSMNTRVPARPADAASWDLRGQNVPGTSMHNVTSGESPFPAGFTPRAEESQQEARTRVIDQTLNVARRNGGEPVDLG
jgi:hypothetical protein